MDARYPIRKAQLLEECQVAPEVFEQVLPRLRTFMAPFVDTLQGQAPRAHAQTYVRGLLSDVERKNVESIAYHFGQDRLGLQGFIGWDDWDDAPLRHTLRSQVGQHLGQADGVLVFDPSAFPKSGRIGRGGAAVVGSSGQSRQLSSGHLLGLCVAQGAYAGRPAVILAQRMDPGEGALGQSRCAQSPSWLPHPSPVSLGDAGDQWRCTAASLDCRGR